jgi:hypothetical protein
MDNTQFNHYLVFILAFPCFCFKKSMVVQFVPNKFHGFSMFCSKKHSFPDFSIQNLEIRIFCIESYGFPTAFRRFHGPPRSPVALEVELQRFSKLKAAVLAAQTEEELEQVKAEQMGNLGFFIGFNGYDIMGLLMGFISNSLINHSIAPVVLFPIYGRLVGTMVYGRYNYRL